MQLWLFFIPGAGGDGIANLLERATNITPIDGNKQWWRVHRIVNNSTKFYAPTIDHQGCFRYSQKFDSAVNRLHDQYVDLVNSNINTVVTSHDVTLKNLWQSHHLDILTHNQIKVLIHTNDYQSAAINFATKNLMPCWQLYEPVIDQSQFDYVLDASQIQSDWNYFYSFCNRVGVNLLRDQYCCYQQIVAGNTAYMSDNFGIDQYQASIVGNSVTYKKTGTWNLQ
jgi:hypothetical protein